MEKIRKQICKWGILALSLVLLLVNTAAVEGPCSVIVRLKSDEGQLCDNVTVEVVRVARTFDGEYVLLPEFLGVDVDLNGMTEADAVDSAGVLHQHLLQNDLSGKVAVTNAFGEALFADLEEGIYLIFERGGQKVTFLPYLIALPDGRVRDVVSDPKVSERGDKMMHVTKHWDDGDDFAGVRPASVRVRLLRNGKAFRVVQLSAANGWSYTFTELPDTGDYSVQEIAVRGYTADYQMSQDGVVITNRLRRGEGVEEESDPIPTTGQLTVRKCWMDNDNEARLRPESLTVQLVQDDKTVVQTAVLNEANGWQHIFTGLDTERLYTVREITVPHYEASYENSDVGVLVVTNTYEEAPVIPPDGPTIPQTGAITWPLYLMTGVGALLILLGVLDLRRRRDADD